MRGAPATAAGRRCACRRHGRQSYPLLSPPPSPQYTARRKVATLIARTPERVAGTCMIIAAVDVLMGIVTAEALYSGNYTTAHNTISDLGANPIGGTIPKASAIVFDVSMITTGLLILASAYLLYRARGSVVVSIAMTAFALGLLGVGIFPENLPRLHTSFASVSFLGGAIAAIASYRLVRTPFRYVAVLLGGVALVTLVIWTLGASQPVGFLGEGGIERWVVYPVTMWLAGFAGYLLAETAPPDRR